MLRRSLLASGITLAVSMSLLGVPAQAARYVPPQPQQDWVTPSYRVAPPRSETKSVRGYATPAPQWPKAGVSEVDLPTSRDRQLGMAAAVPVAGMPVTIADSSAGRVRVQMFDRAATRQAGVDGVLFGLSRVDGIPAKGRARVTLSYKDFATAYGGDWNTRLRLVSLPDRKPLLTTNDSKAQTLTATVDLSGAQTMLAAEAGTSGGAGDFGATTLQASATWTGGSSAGDFTWSYPLRMPPANGGPLPSLALSYSSQSVDGRMVASNNQPSVLGEGFEMSTGFIERSYKSCDDDGQADNFDQCWFSDNATLSLAGHAGELIKDASVPDRWHLRKDDGTYVQRRIGAGNGDDNGEWWVVTTTDGTQYWFGGKPANNSTLTVPVWGNNSNEPGNGVGDSFLTQAWRWNLDHVVDQHGNTMSYVYAKETNKYAKKLQTTSPVTYDRAAHLVRIEYGTRTGSTGSAPMVVEFNYQDRCLTSSCGTHDKGNWPDTPYDLDCTGSSCDQASPSFWTTRRLTSVTTKLWSGTAYAPVTSWAFTHSFRDPGDSTRPGLILEKISQTGHVRVTTTVPDVTFDYVQKNNRVDPNFIPDHSPSMNWFRLAHINTESGSRMEVTYSAGDCYTGRMPNTAALESNTLRCYPVRWKPAGQSQPVWDFFHKYVVKEVHEVDMVTPGNPTTVHTYDYVGDPAWHFADEDGLVKAEDKTWSVWRGYGTVRAIKGATGTTQSMTETRYFRGMHGDKLPTGTRTVQLPAAGGAPAIDDDDAFAGMTRETIVYNGPTGSEASGEVSVPWKSAATATRTINNVTVHANYTGVQEKRSRLARDLGRPMRLTTSTTLHDSFGMPVEQEEQFDGVAKCTLTEYGRNTDPQDWIIGLAKRVRQFATTCSRAKQTGLTKDELVSEVKTYYDSSSNVDAVPTRGLATRTEGFAEWVNNAPTFMTLATSEYDANGRISKAIDAKGVETVTAYTNNAGGQLSTQQVTKKVATNNHWVTTTVLEPAFGTPARQTDPNGRVTSLEYDGLGRATSIWRPGRDKGVQSANELFEYKVKNNAPSVVKTSKLTPSGGYVATYSLLDGLMRPRQTQAPRGDGTAGTLATDKFYDSAGRVWKTYPAYVTTGTPGETLIVPNEGSLPARMENTFDGVDRTVLSIKFIKSGGSVIEHSRTVTAYGGDRVDVTPPNGGVAVSTFTDAQGKTTATWQYRGAVPTPAQAGTYDVTSYVYTPKGQLARVTDAGGKQWTSTYDLRGNKEESSDPDAGTSKMKFNKFGELEYTIDPRQIRLDYTYDSIGRKKTVMKGASKLAEWVYEGLANSRGQITKTTHFDAGGNAYTREVLGFHVSYQASGVRYSVPAVEGDLAGNYDYFFTYRSDNSPETLEMPDIDGAGGMSTETLTFEYSTLGQPKKLRTSLDGDSTYVADTTYNGYGEVSSMTLQNNGGSTVTLVRNYQEGTRLLAQSLTSRQTAPTDVFNLNYSYDAADGIKKISESVYGDHQCFADDYLDRLKQAWTPLNGDCLATPSAGALGGPAKYWTAWDFDANGNRKEQVENVTANGVLTTTYNYPNEPHRLKSTVTKNSSGVTVGTRTWDYELGGYVKSRDGMAIAWDAEGHVATEGSAKFRYDAEGARLVREDLSGKTLYLPGQELRLTGTTKKTVRFYSHAGGQVAMRTSGSVTWLAGDHQGTMSVSIKASDQSVAIRRQDPYGNPRAGSGTWPVSMDKGFVGGTKDASGLTHLGAREYDSTVGQFISVDPLFVADDPQQLNGYQYAAHNPVSKSDPDGTCVVNEDTGKCDRKVDAELRAQRAKNTHTGCMGSTQSSRSAACPYPPPSLTFTCDLRCAKERLIASQREQAAINQIKRDYNNSKFSPSGFAKETHETWDASEAPEYVTTFEDLALNDPSGLGNLTEVTFGWVQEKSTSDAISGALTLGFEKSGFGVSGTVGYERSWTVGQGSSLGGSEPRDPNAKLGYHAPEIWIKWTRHDVTLKEPFKDGKVLYTGSYWTAEIKWVPVGVQSAKYPTKISGDEVAKLLPH